MPTYIYIYIYNVYIRGFQPYQENMVHTRKHGGVEVKLRMRVVWCIIQSEKHNFLDNPFTKECDRTESQFLVSIICMKKQTSGNKPLDYPEQRR